MAKINKNQSPSFAHIDPTTATLEDVQAIRARSVVLWKQKPSILKRATTALAGVASFAILLPIGLLFARSYLTIKNKASRLDSEIDFLLKDIQEIEQSILNDDEFQLSYSDRIAGFKQELEGLKKQLQENASNEYNVVRCSNRFEKIEEAWNSHLQQTLATIRDKGTEDDINTAQDARLERLETLVSNLQKKSRQEEIDITPPLETAASVLTSLPAIGAISGIGLISGGASYLSVFGKNRSNDEYDNLDDEVTEQKRIVEKLRAIATAQPETEAGRYAAKTVSDIEIGSVDRLGKQLVNLRKNSLMKKMKLGFFSVCRNDCRHYARVWIGLTKKHIHAPPQKTRRKKEIYL